MKRLIVLLFGLWMMGLPVMAQQTTGTTLDILNVRTDPMIGENIIGQLPYETSVSIQGRDNSGAWLYVSANGLSGWVSSQYISWDGVALSALPLVGVNAPTTSANTTSSQPVVTGNAIPVTSKARLNVRSEPNTSGTILTTLRFDQTVNAIARNADGSWLLVDLGSLGGWVSATYVRPTGDINTLPTGEQVASGTEIPVSTTTQNETVQTPVTRNGQYVITGPDPNNSTSYDVEITLHWNTTANLDLRVIGPDGYLIVPGVPPSPTGGYFQQPVGANENCNTSDGAALEVITWDKGTAPSGLYQIEAEYMNNCFPDQEEETLFWVSVKNDGPEVEFWVYFIEPDDLFEFEFVRP